MDNLFIAFFVLVIFAICMSLKNRKNKEDSFLIEGQTNITQENNQTLANEAQLLSSQGLCYPPEYATNQGVEPIWPRDEETCTGITGFNLEFVSITDKNNSLVTIDVSDEVKTNELTLQNNDIVQYGDDNNLYVYYGPDIILEDTTSDDIPNQIVLFPYTHNVGDDEKTEYCIGVGGDTAITDATDSNTCSDPNIFISPLTSPDAFTIINNSENYGTEQCDTDRLTNSGIICVDPREIRLNNCYSNDLSGNIFQVKPKDFWKTQYVVGSNQQISEMCEGERTRNIWVYNSALNTMMDSQRFAEIQQNVDSTIIDDLNTTFIQEYQQDRSQDSNRITSENYDTMLQALEAAAQAAMTATCSYEGSDQEPANLYLGNVNSSPNQNTAGLYNCQGGDDRLEATTVVDTCPTDNLECNENYAETVGLRRYIHCPDGSFKFEGCSPGQCSLPQDFYTKYRGLSMTNLPSREIVENQNDSEVNLVSIHNLKDLVSTSDDGLKIECTNTHHGTPSITQCRNGSALQIEGCEINECHANDLPNNELSKYDDLVTNQGTLVNWIENNVNLKCSRNNYQINDLTQFTQYIDNLENDENYHGIQFTCNSTDDTDGPYPISITNGCEQNICKNPKSNNIYDYSKIKPQTFNETLNIVPIEQEKYHKYVIDENSGNISDNSNIIPSDLFEKVKCGRNYTLNNQNSGPGDNRVLTIDNITCNSIYDINAVRDIDNKSMPYIRNSIPAEGEPPLTSNENIQTFIGELNETDRYLNFSLDGCEINQCMWPIYSHSDTNSLNYNKPRRRIVDVPSGYDDVAIESTILSSLQNENGDRYLNGYYQDVNEGEDITQDKTVLQTAEEWAGHSNGETSLKCYEYQDSSNSGCQVEEKYRNFEIDSMIYSSEQSNLSDLVMKGQIDQTQLSNYTLDNGNIKWSEYFEDVKRGGPFKIERCFNEIAEPIVLCQGIDGQNCTGDNSECSSEISGCEQNRCKLSKEDADNGTRLLVERNTNDGIIYQNIGGVTNDHFEGVTSPLISVDQIRNITCDEDFSKSGISDDNQEITIRCPVEGGDFIIDNKCQRTICDNEGTIDEINGVIKLINHNTFDVISPLRTCSTQSIYNSHNFNNSISPDQGPSLVTEIPTITTDQCHVINNDTNIVVDTEMFSMNSSRYSFDPTTLTFSCGVTGDDNIITSVSEDPERNGLAIEKCNYKVGQDTPSRSLQGCQPKLCHIPSTLPDGVIINPEFSYPGLDINSSFSKDIFNVNYHLLPEGDISLTTEQTNLIENIPDKSLFMCNNGYHEINPIDFTCEQNSPNYNSGNTGAFVVTDSCVINRCSIPQLLLSGENNINHNFTSDTEPKTVSELISGLSCGNNYYIDESIRIECNQDSDTSPGNFSIQRVNPIGELIEEGEWNNYCRPHVCDTSNISPSTENQRNIDSDFSDKSETMQTYLTGVVVSPDANRCYNNLDGVISSNPTTYSNVSCNTNDCHGTANVSCSESGILNVRGCDEKYCVLPDLYSGNNINYNLNNNSSDGLSISEKLSELERVQLDEYGGITKEQFERTIDDSNFICSTFARSELGGPSVSCPENGNEFIFTGCNEYDFNNLRSYTNGSTTYSYYPRGCSLIKQNAFIYLSGTDVFGDNMENDSGVSISHTVNREQLYGDTEGEDDTNNPNYYFYKYPSAEEDSTIKPRYLSPEGQNEDELISDGWSKINMYVKYNSRENSQKNTLMKNFMDTSREWCDRIDNCGGFNVSTINALTAEINAIDKCPSETPCRNLLTGEVNVDNLRTFLQDNGSFLEMGTFKSEQKSSDCYNVLADPQTDFHQDWGQTTPSGGNSYVYVNVDGFDILNPNIINDNMSVFMRQVIPIGDSLEQAASGRGFTGMETIDENIDPER